MGIDELYNTADEPITLDAATKSALDQSCARPYVCKGTPVDNLPHDGSSQAASSVTVSLERKSGGAAGSLQNAGDNAALKICRARERFFRRASRFM